MINKDKFRLRRDKFHHLFFLYFKYNKDINEEGLMLVAVIQMHLFNWCHA